MQTALIVHYNTRMGERDRKGTQQESLEALNQHLAQGWKVVHAYPMSGHATDVAVSLVILEK